jgi:hypothetical protein
MVVGIAIILPMPGSRAPVILVLGSLFLLFLVTRFRGRLRLIGGAVLLALVLIQGVGGSGLLEGWDLLAERTVQTGEEEAKSRILRLFQAPIIGIERVGIVGYGVGTNHQAAPALVSGSWEGFLGVDQPALRVIAEIGIWGWLVLMALKGALLYIAYRAVRRSHTPVELIIGATAFCMLLNQLIIPVVFNVVASALYWGSVGAVLGVWSMQEVREEQYRAQSRTALS